MARIRGATAADVLVTAGLGAFLLLLVPALLSSSRTGDAVCLSNLRQLGAAIRIYAEDQRTLQGGLHPSVYNNILEYDPYQSSRSQLLARLHDVLGDAVSARMATCPVGNRLNSERAFWRFYQLTLRAVPPTYYALNNVGSFGNPDTVRITNPMFYFGVSPYGSPDDYTPKRIGAIPNPDREWMIADTWYRQGSGPGELSQEGTYPYDWTGEALPPFAPHGRRSTTGYVFSSSGERSQQCSRIRSQMSDGVTNTLFFDGHAAPVPSRRYVVGGFDILYGFPGTVNPAKMNPPPESLYWSGVWQ